MTKNCGYTITRTVLFEGGTGFALGENSKAPAPFVTWQFDNNAKDPYYFWGHYHADKNAAERDFHSRVADHKRLYGQREVKPLSRQMKEAAKQAPKKKVPDRGDR